MISNYLKIIILFVLVSFQKAIEVKAQFKDTLLNMVISKPFFYNILKSQENRIFAGTSEGIFEIHGEAISKYGSQKGYITTDKQGNPIIDKNGIKFHRGRTYSHLLPYSEMGQEREYHVSTGKIFYLCSGGRLFVFDIMPYKYSYPNHSIRSISQNLIGTYSGIYLNGKKLDEPAPPYTDSYIRQFGDRAFICSYPLCILEKNALDSGQLIPGINFSTYSEPDGKMINDILPTRDGRGYFLATMNKLIVTDYYFKKDSILFRKKDEDLPVVLISGANERLYFTSNNELLSLDYGSNKIDHVITLDAPIQAGVYFGDQIYLITENALYRYNSAFKLEKLSDLEQAHSLILMNGSELIIASNLGLYHFNLVSRNLSVIIKNVEFNRRALYNDFDRTSGRDNVIAGSINGLYTIQAGDIPELISSNKPTLESTGHTNITNILLGGLSLALLLFLGASIREYRKKLKSAQLFIEDLQTPKQEVTLEIIEDFIRNNLPNASIKTLTDEFELNAPQLYSILKPERPGSIIQKIRLDKVREMREKNQTIQEISEATGLSETYLKKIKT